MDRRVAQQMRKAADIPEANLLPDVTHRSNKRVASICCRIWRTGPTRKRELLGANHTKNKKSEIPSQGSKNNHSKLILFHWSNGLYIIGKEYKRFSQHLKTWKLINIKTWPKTKDQDFWPKIGIRGRKTLRLISSFCMVDELWIAVRLIYYLTIPSRFLLGLSFFELKHVHKYIFINRQAHLV